MLGSNRPSVSAYIWRHCWSAATRSSLHSSQPPRRACRRLSSLSGRKRLQVCSRFRKRENPTATRSAGPSTRISLGHPITRDFERCHVRSPVTAVVSTHSPHTAGEPVPGRGLVPARGPGPGRCGCGRWCRRRGWCGCRRRCRGRGGCGSRLGCGRRCRCWFGCRRGSRRGGCRRCRCCSATIRRRCGGRRGRAGRSCGGHCGRRSGDHAGDGGGRRQRIHGSERIDDRRERRGRRRAIERRQRRGRCDRVAELVDVHDAVNGFHQRGRRRCVCMLRGQCPSVGGCERRDGGQESGRCQPCGQDATGRSSVTPAGAEQANAGVSIDHRHCRGGGRFDHDLGGNCGRSGRRTPQRQCMARRWHCSSHGDIGSWWAGTGVRLDEAAPPPRLPSRASLASCCSLSSAAESLLVTAAGDGGTTKGVAAGGGGGMVAIDIAGGAGGAGGEAGAGGAADAADGLRLLNRASLASCCSFSSVVIASPPVVPPSGLFAVLWDRGPFRRGHGWGSRRCRRRSGCFWRGLRSWGRSRGRRGGGRRRGSRGRRGGRSRLRDFRRRGLGRRGRCRLGCCAGIRWR